jgi:hypothetical protein
MSYASWRAGGNPIGVRRQGARPVASAWLAWRELRSARRMAKHARLAARYTGSAAHNRSDTLRDLPPHVRTGLSDPPSAMAWFR